jgi:uncharacterized repeat protein (TIGR03803 family)
MVDAPRRAVIMTNSNARAAFGIVLLVCAASWAGAQNVQTLYGFWGGTRGMNPRILVPQSDGSAFGDAGGGTGCPVGLCGMIYKLSAKQGDVVIHGFTGAEDGADPRGLVPDGKGGIYGVTFSGGAYGQGNIFRVDASGEFQVVYSFAGSPDGAMPNGLVLDAAGNLYGTTYVGGAYNAGSVFELDQTGKESVIYSFTGGSGGYLPGGGVLDASGNFYGSTFAGGVGCLGNPGCGLVFEVNTTTGEENTLYSFTGTGGDGETPGHLLRDSHGNLYGTTGGGGNSSCEGGCGTLFRLTQGPGGNWSETIIHTFTSGADGAYPAGLVATKDSIYGTTGGAVYGCSGSSCGTVYQLSPTGEFTTIYTFSGGAGGEDPYLQFQDGTGTLIGTTYSGGHLNCLDSQGYGCGTVFRLTP